MDRRLLVPVAALLLTTGCGFPAGPRPPPPETAARDYLAKVVELAQRGDFEALCDLGSGNCESALDEAGRQSVPLDPPRVVGTRVIQPQDRGNGAWTSGGLLLILCGLDRQGRPYENEMLVFESEGRLIAIEAVYWMTRGIAEGNVVGASPSPDVDCSG